MTNLAFSHQVPIGAPSSTRRARSGVALTALPVLFLAFDGVMKLAAIAPVREAFVRTGFPMSQAPVLGVLLLACVALHLVPRTSVLGAALLTAYLGGAVATHLRLGDPTLSHTLFPVYLGVMLWGGLALRDARVLALAPWRSPRNTHLAEDVP